MVRIDDKGSIAEQVDSEFCQCVLCGKGFLVMEGVVEFCWLQLALQITDDTFRIVCIVLY